MSRPEPIAAATVRIVVAEDSPTQAQRLRHVLEQQGYAVEVGTDGRHALELARKLPPTMILSDVVMPEMDGYELCRRVKADLRLADVPVILVTTMSDPHDVIRALACRADNFIVKPYDEPYLLDRVQHVLANREMRRTPDAGADVEIFFNGEKHVIAADRMQILNLLLSTYDAAIQRNKELTRSQEELRRLNTRLAAVNKELETFSYSVSHDLRAPLRHIDGYLQMLREDAGSAFSSEGERYVKVIADAGSHMARLIDDLLAFSRIGQAEMRETDVELDRLIPEVIASLEMATRGRDIEWNIAPLPRVVGDPSMLRQVFANLLGNAVKYTRPRPTARIELGCAGGDDQRIILFVRDNGVGFDMQHAGKLFGVFQRLHRREEFEGTGVGLANVLRIVTRHGGRIWADAAPDAGATFYLTLKPSPPA